MRSKSDIKWKEIDFEQMGQRDMNRSRLQTIKVDQFSEQRIELILSEYTLR